MSDFTFQSEYGDLRSVIMKSPAAAFISNQKISYEWKRLNYMSRPDFSVAVDEYQQFESLVKSHDVMVHYLPVDDRQTIDSIYCRDAAIVSDHGLIVCKMGKDARRSEPGAVESLALELEVPILGRIEGSGSLEGGDVAWLDSRTLLAGHSYRTNEEGLRQLEELLAPFDIEVIRVDLPHYRGPNDVFHLMSVFSPVAEDIAVVFSPLVPISFRKLLLNRSIRLVEVPEQEFETMGCNVLALKPGLCLMVEGNPLTKAGLEKAGCEVMTFPGNEISLKGGGGPTCLTRPLLRGI